MGLLEAVLKARFDLETLDNAVAQQGDFPPTPNTRQFRDQAADMTANAITG
jgi:hypothetical protein